MLTNLYHGECDNNGIGTGTATIGSSEAIMLGGLAMKKAWQAKRKAAGKPYDKPNLVRRYFLESEPQFLSCPGTKCNISICIFHPAEKSNDCDLNSLLYARVLVKM